MSSLVNPSTSRRAVLGGSGAAAVLAAGLNRPAYAEGPALKAAVLEHRDQWTNAIGLAVLLRAAGVTVVPLDPSLPATEQGVDLIALGSFANNAATYGEFTTAHAASIQDFVKAGGVVIDFAQSDQFDPFAAYLPAPLAASRNDADFDTIYPIASDHPLVAHLRRTDGRVFTGRSTQVRVSWESLVDWNMMRVLLACGPTGRPPALVEGAHGAGRFLVTSLTVDKCYRADETTLAQPADAVADSQAFFTSLAAYVRSVREGRAPEVTPTLKPIAGPLVGDTGTEHSRVLIRPSDDLHDRKWWNLTFWAVGSSRARTVQARLSPENDHTVLFDIDDLRPDTAYEYSIVPVGVPVKGFDLTGGFRTATPDHRRTKMVMGLGSCVWTEDNPIWERIRTEGCESFVLLGDTPYIDSTNLSTARQKQRAFLEHPHVNAVTRSMPTWATWDDHDFGGNDVHGDLAGKRNNRTAFVDYRANASFGHDADGRRLRRRSEEGEGIYTSFRRGPVEVFLIDPRWFSRTETSWADPSRTTGIGLTQWEWLQRGLQRSTAPFKALATGMIWDDKQNSESDDWGTYAHERDAIFEFVRQHRISGVFLVGGDIHVSRALNYGVTRTGYDLWQFIVSPMHSSVIPSLNVANPALVHSAVEPHVFLRLEADTTAKPATLTATWINRAGERVFEVVTDTDQLAPRDAWVDIERVGMPDLAPGAGGPITTTFTNNAEHRLARVSMSLEVPAGWTVSALTPSRFNGVRRGESVTTTWDVVPADGAEIGQHRVTARADHAGNRRELSAEASVRVLPAAPIPLAQMAVAGVSSEEATDAAANVLDGNPATFWHTTWRATPAPRYPHWVSLALGGPHTISGLEYLPRQDGPNGRFKDVEVYVSDNGQDWGPAVATATFNDGTGASLVTLPEVRGQFVKLVGLTSQNGQQWGGAAGVTVFGTPA